MDISTIKAVEQRIDILHPGNDEKIGLAITLLPMDDPKVKGVINKLANHRLARKNKKVTVEESESQSVEICATAVTGWEWDGDLTFHGEKPECTPRNVAKVLQELPWIRRQVDEALGNIAENFRTAATD